MTEILNRINGSIRLKADSFQEAWGLLGITYIQANPKLKPMDPYFLGLVDTDGSIVFNYASNRIEC